ncbi:MAG: PilZ domain-containing protein [Pseudomonadales bacterium]
MNIVGQDYKKYQFDAQLLGYQKGECVLVTLMSKPGQILLHSGLKATLDGVLADGRFSFESEIEQVFESPFLYLHLDYPVAVDFQQQRQHIRVKVNTPVEVNAHTSLGMTASTIHGHMMDVSYGGARIVLEKQLTTMVTKISIGVMLESEGLERNMTLTAEICDQAELAKDYPECGFAYGVEFIAVDLVDNLFLRSFCLQEISRNRELMC